MKKAKPKQTGTAVRPWRRPPPRRLTKKWARWVAMSFIRVMDRKTRKEALQILGMTRKMIPQRGRVQYDWSKDDEWRHP
jgi:hypothetical protein